MHINSKSHLSVKIGGFLFLSNSCKIGKFLFAE